MNENHVLLEEFLVAGDYKGLLYLYKINISEVEVNKATIFQL
jgi:hypothetical protein